jgi:prophage antirepressor-like protein
VVIPGLSLRVIEIDGDPWFVAADVCKSLEYSADTSATLTKHVHDDDRRPFNLNTLSNRGSIRGTPASP